MDAQAIWDWIESTDLVPRQFKHAGKVRRDRELDELITALRDCWMAVRPRGAEHHKILAARLQILNLFQQRLHLHGTSRSVPQVVQKWIGPGAWVSLGPLLADRAAIVSSRMPRLLSSSDAWLNRLRFWMDVLREQRKVLVVHPRTAGAEFTIRAAARCGVPMVRVWDVTVTRQPGRAWSHLWRSIADLHAQLPATELLPCQPIRSDCPAGTPLRDRCVLAWSNDIYVLALRHGGNLHTLLRRRLTGDNCRVFLVDEADLQDPAARGELLGLGARLWPNQANSTPRLLPRTPTLEAGSERSRKRSRRLLDGFLTHTTRACPGPWPLESRDEYLDSLLDPDVPSDHTALGSLLRIIAQRRLIASSRTIRGGYQVVSFTEQNLAELPAMRTFRSHRSRWDFEPYGISIDRCWLRQHGARPVRYGTEAEWDGLVDSDRPFYQLARSRTGSGKVLDWTREREWRHLGDVDMSQLGADQAVVFVPTAREADIVDKVSPWPVVNLGSLEVQGAELICHVPLEMRAELLHSTK